MFAFDEAQRLLLSGSPFAVHHHLGRVLDRNEHFLFGLVSRDGVTPMRSVQKSRGGHVSKCIVRKHNDSVAGVGLDGIDLTDLRINIKTVVELDVGLGSLNQPLRFRKRPVGGSIFRTFRKGRDATVRL